MIPGDRVTILNAKQGRIVVEGKATFRGSVNGLNRAFIRFDGEDEDRERYIDQDVQDLTTVELEAYIANLNRTFRP